MSMTRTDIIRRVCEAARANLAKQEVMECVIKQLLDGVPRADQDAMRSEMDNAVAAIKREIRREGGAMTLHRRPVSEADESDSRFLRAPQNDNESLTLQQMRVKLNRGNR